MYFQDNKPNEECWWCNLLSILVGIVILYFSFQNYPPTRWYIEGLRVIGSIVGFLLILFGFLPHDDDNPSASGHV